MSMAAEHVSLQAAALLHNPGILGSFVRESLEQPRSRRTEGTSVFVLNGRPIAKDNPSRIRLATDRLPLPIEEPTGEVVLRDTFEAADGTPLDGRKPAAGRGAWKVASGKWTVEKGAAALAGH